MTRGAPVDVVRLGAGAGGAVLILIVAGYVVARGCGGQPAPGTAATPGAAAAIGSAGVTAKGTDELRQAGCAHAAVVDMQRLLGAAGQVREGEPRTMITCDVAAAASAPGCETLASTYFRAVGAAVDGNVCVRVVAEGAREPVCSRLYAPSGADLGAFPRLP